MVKSALLRRATIMSINLTPCFSANEQEMLGRYTATKCGLVKCAAVLVRWLLSYVFEFSAIEYL